MRRWNVVAVAAVLAATAGVALGATYTWDGTSSGYWTFGCNWDVSGSGAECYPSTTSDDARIAQTSCQNCGGPPYTIDCVSVTIDDLTISVDTTLEEQTLGSQTLTVDSLTVVGPAEVTLTDSLSITG